MTDPAAAPASRNDLQHAVELLNARIDSTRDQLRVELHQEVRGIQQTINRQTLAILFGVLAAMLGSVPLQAAVN